MPPSRNLSHRRPIRQAKQVLNNSHKGETKMDRHRSLRVRKGLLSLLGAGIVCIVFAATTLAQDTSKSETKMVAGSKKVQVERGEVVYVQGNDLVVKRSEERRVGKGCRARWTPGH